jgi:hypothetical protein
MRPSRISGPITESLTLTLTNLNGKMSPARRGPLGATWGKSTVCGVTPLIMTEEETRRIMAQCLLDVTRVLLRPPSAPSEFVSIKPRMGMGQNVCWT